LAIQDFAEPDWACFYRMRLFFAAAPAPAPLAGRQLFSARRSFAGGCSTSTIAALQLFER